MRGQEPDNPENAAVDSNSLRASYEVDWVAHVVMCFGGGRQAAWCSPPATGPTGVQVRTHWPQATHLQAGPTRVLQVAAAADEHTARVAHPHAAAVARFDLWRRQVGAVEPGGSRRAN